MSDANVKEELRARLVDSFVVENEPVLILRHNKGFVYLIGTHHNEEHYATAVAHLIAQIRPHTVAVELCRTNLQRYNANSAATLSLTTSAVYQPPKSTYMEFVPPRLKHKAIGEELLLGLVSEALKYEKYCVRRNHAKQSVLRNDSIVRFRVKPKVFHSKIKIGREMTVPFGELTWSMDKRRPLYLLNSLSPYKIMLADRPVEETFCRIAAALSDEERKMIQIYQSNFLRLFVSFSGKRTLMLNLLDKNIALKNAVLHDRDMYMARALIKAVVDVKPKSAGIKARVVAIVGKSHVAGIMECWQKIISKRKMSKKKPRKWVALSLLLYSIVLRRDY